MYLQVSIRQLEMCGRKQYHPPEAIPTSECTQAFRSRDLLKDAIFVDGYRRISPIMKHNYSWLSLNSIVAQARLLRLRCADCVVRCDEWQARLRIWFGGLRTRLTRRMNQEAKYQLGIRERELMLHASVKKDEGRNAGQPALESDAESPHIMRAASTCELIVASLLEQAKTFMAEVTNVTSTSGASAPDDGQNPTKTIGG